MYALRNLTICVMGLLWHLAAVAQTYAPPISLTNFPNNLSDVDLVDLDEDGDEDILLTSRFDKRIGWLENEAGAFKDYQVLLDDLAGIFQIHAADFDNDGDKDFAIGILESPPRLYLSRNDGSENFAAIELLATNNHETQDIKSMDVDADGDQDLILASKHRVAMYKNLGGGSFGGKQTISATSFQVMKIRIADLDGDGDEDIASANTGDDKVAWYENLGSGNFGAAQVLATPVPGDFEIHLSDLDNDGDVDVIYTSPTVGKIGWVENTGTGFAAMADLITTDIKNEIAVTDFDGDGLKDIINITNSATDNLGWHKNLGGASFGPAIVLGTSENISLLTTADFDGDGAADLIAADQGLNSNNGVYQYVNNGAGAVNPAIELTGGFGGAYYETLVLDLNNDGILDIAHSILSRMGWHQGNADGSFEPSRLLFAGWATSVEKGDWDGDGLEDLVAVSQDKLVRLKNTGLGTLVETVMFDSPGEEVHEVAIIDTDLDGDLDILAGIDPVNFFNKEYILKFENLGGGSFGPPETIFTGDLGMNYSISLQNHIKPEDLDNDGDLDFLLVALNRSAAEVYVLENTGSGYTGHFLQSMPETIYEGALEDIDADGSADIILRTLNATQSTYWRMSNLGSLNFSAPQPMITLSPAVYNSTRSLTDIDGDGKKDIMTVSEADGINWYQSLGNGNYGPKQLISNGDFSASRVKAADFDADGDVDFLVPDFNRLQTYFIENLTVGGGCASAPVNLQHTYSAGSPLSTLTLSWDAIPEALKYRVDISKVDPLPVISKVFASNTNSLTITTTIPAGIELEWTVRAACPGDTSAASETAVINIPSLRTASSRELVYPNPAANGISIQSPEEATLAVYNSMGKLVYSEPNAEELHQIDLTNWPSGIYYYHLTAPDRSPNEPQSSGNFIKR